MNTTLPHPTLAVYRALSDHSPEGILVVDTATRTVVEANPRLGELFRVSPARLIGRGPDEVCAELGRSLDDPGAFAVRFNRFLELPEASGRLDLRTAGAQDPTLVAYVTSVRDEQGEVTAKLWSFEDTSRQRALEKGLQESQQLDTAARLAAGIVHDSNNLLTVVLGQLYLAADRLAAVPEAAAAVKPAVDAAEKCADLLGSVLRVARQQGGHRELLQWEDVLGEAEVLVRAAAPSGVDVRTRYEADLPPVHAERAQLHQVVMNLAFNAIDAMPDGGELDITLTREHGALCLAVTDNGEGMPASVRERIFDAFFTTKGEGRGTGLGLHMVSAIVGEHGGTIRCLSEPGAGTTFRITLPTAGSAVPLPVVSSHPEVVSS